MVLSSIELVQHMEGSFTWSFHNSPLDPRPPSKRSQVAIMRYGCTWTLLAISMLMSHEETTSNASSLKRGPAHTRLTKRKVGTTMKVTTHPHLCRLYEHLCFISSGYDASRTSNYEQMRPMHAKYVRHVTQHRAHMSHVSKKKTAGDMWRLCGHFLLSARGFPEFKELLDAPIFQVAVL